MRILVTGGAGFVGASLALTMAARHPGWKVVAFDNLRRRGSELNLPRLREAGVEFVHGDVREPTDLLALKPITALVECSAEPSALAGVDGHGDYVVRSNLLGAYHCLELARRDEASVVFLSTSRVYPVGALASVRYHGAETRFELDDEQFLPGVSAAGIAETFPLDGARTLYGTTKLAAELLVAEYAESYGIRTIIDRCGVIAGPGQLGKVDQGVFTYWLLAHYFRRPLRYFGFGGTGFQLRDVLHVDDLVELVDEQLMHAGEWAGTTANVGGGIKFSLSLHETTTICEELTGNRVISRDPGGERPGDIPVYVSDCSRLFARTEWRPKRPPRQVLEDVHRWIAGDERAVQLALGF